VGLTGSYFFLLSACRVGQRRVLSVRLARKIIRLFFDRCVFQLSVGRIYFLFLMDEGPAGAEVPHGRSGIGRPPPWVESLCPRRALRVRSRLFRTFATLIPLFRARPPTTFPGFDTQHRSTLLDGWPFLVVPPVGGSCSAASASSPSLLQPF